MARSVAIIGARLNSSRLPGKQLLPLAGKPMIAHIFRRLEAADAFDRIILATTDDTANEPLVRWAAESGHDAYAYGGDVNDLMGRVDEVVDAYEADIIGYICGDSPLIEPETLGKLVAAMQADPAVEFATLPALPEGQKYLHEGFSIYRRSLWKRMMAVAHEPYEREHVGVVFHALGKVAATKTALCDDDPIFHSIDHRISVDTPSDYRFMSEIYDRWFDQFPEQPLVDLRWVIAQIGGDMGLRDINARVHQKSCAEHSVPIAIMCHAGQATGFGHLSRALRMAQILQDGMGAGVHLHIIGAARKSGALDLIPHDVADDAESCLDQIRARQNQLVIIDAPSQSVEALGLARGLSRAKLPVLAVDCLFDEIACQENLAAHVYLPAVATDSTIARRWAGRLSAGWDCLLLPPALPSANTGQDGGLIVLTGAGDSWQMGRMWPSLLAPFASSLSQITWVQGPYAAPPATVPGIQPVQAIEDIPAFLSRFDIAVCVFGVSFFECLGAGLATIVWAPEGTMSRQERNEIEQAGVAMVLNNPEDLAGALQYLLDHPEQAQAMRDRAKTQLAQANGSRLLHVVRGLVAPEDQRAHG